MKKTTIKLIEIITASVSICTFITSAAFAIGYQSTTDSKNDTFNNSGTISGSQKNSGGASTQIVAQRGRVSQADIGKVNYTSSNNKYINSGKITATQSNSGGANIQGVGQEIH